MEPTTFQSTANEAQGVTDARQRRHRRRSGQVPIRSWSIAELGQVPICAKAIDEIRPAPENDKLYRRINADDPQTRELVASIKQLGILDPLVVTEDGFILSGHRRHFAARRAGLKSLPCRTAPIRRRDNIDYFVKLLREFNRQRIKTADERLREVLVDVSQEDAYERLVSDRMEKGNVDVESIDLGEPKRRAKISEAKTPFLEAIKAVVEDRKEFWPLSARQIHYALLNDPPLRHASKPKSRYANDHESYKSLIDLLTRARLAGLISFQAINDETRPVTIWKVYGEVGQFMKDAFGDLLKGYWRNLMQSQHVHVELIVEKNTVAGIVSKVAGEFCIHMTSGRGYCSLPPRYDMWLRFRHSGKSKLVVLIVSDFDPDGEMIAESFGRSMRDDFGLADIHPVKVALNADQVEWHDLPPGGEAKKGSTNYAKFVSKHGDQCWELEALPPDELQDIVREAILSVIDVDAYNDEVDREHEDAKFLEGVRRTVREAVAGIVSEAGDADE